MPKIEKTTVFKAEDGTMFEAAELAAVYVADQEVVNQLFQLPMSEAAAKALEELVNDQLEALVRIFTGHEELRQAILKDLS